MLTLTIAQSILLLDLCRPSALRLLVPSFVALLKDFQSFFACVFAALSKHPTAHPVNVCPESRAAC
jgi:hypothetical protein